MQEDPINGVLRRPKRRHEPIASPRTSLLPYLSQEQISKLPYGPDTMPGRRDVSTPYGIMRVNEWGPTNGRRVLFVHGDATPSPIWTRIAWQLAQRGCRVMTFDLWGRGYTDSPYPMQHEPHLFQNQILYAISSSSISWAGQEHHGTPPTSGFSIVGFSLGGSIAIDFASTFPHLVNSIVAMGPGGMLRRLPPDYQTIYGADQDLLPSDPAMQGLVARICGCDTDKAAQLAGDELRRKTITAAVKAAEVDEIPVSLHNARFLDWQTWTPGIGSGEAEGQKFLTDLIRWQYEHHQGFVRSFYSTARHGPTHGMVHAWKRVCDLVAGKSLTEGQAAPASLLHDSKLLVVLGQDDDIVPADEVREDVAKLIPADKVEFVVLEGDHSFVFPNSDKIADLLAAWWRLAG